MMSTAAKWIAMEIEADLLRMRTDVHATHRYATNCFGSVLQKRDVESPSQV